MPSLLIGPTLKKQITWCNRGLPPCLGRCWISHPWSPSKLHCSHISAWPSAPLIHILTLEHKLDFPAYLRPVCHGTFCLEVTGLWLTLLIVSRSGLDLDLVTQFPSWPCFIAMDLPGNPNSWLNLQSYFPLRSSLPLLHPDKQAAYGFL